MKHILVIAPFAFGYTEHIVNALQDEVGISAEIVYLDYPNFHYSNWIHRLQNSASKFLFKKNLKKTFVYDRVKTKVEERSSWDTIFMIRPDMLDNATLDTVRKATPNLKAYYWDSTRRFPRKVDIIHYFDTVFSYDKEDVDTYNFQFTTNYIFYERPLEKVYARLFFNISTNDYRLPILEALTKYIDSKGWSKKILVYNGSEMDMAHVELITTQKSIAEVGALIAESKIIVEIQRREQIGLSFRIFEALGQRKKLITTNKDIVNYDFYHPQNIWVLDEKEMHIPEQFVNSPYLEINEAVLDPYRIRNWVRDKFEL